MNEPLEKTAAIDPPDRRADRKLVAILRATVVVGGVLAVIGSAMFVAVELFDPRSALAPLQMVECPSGLCTVAEPLMTTSPRVVSGFEGGFGIASTDAPIIRTVRVAVRSSLTPVAWIA